MMKDDFNNMLFRLNLWYQSWLDSELEKSKKRSTYQKLDIPKTLAFCVKK